MVIDGGCGDRSKMLVKPTTEKTRIGNLAGEADAYYYREYWIRYLLLQRF